MEPLATLLRPKNIEDFLGQEHLIGDNGPIRLLMDSGKIPSMIFWGPPASGKTTLAEIIAKKTNSDFQRLSAVMDGKEKLKKILIIARGNSNIHRQTILFIDEIHRWSKAQQDALLPYVESGELTIIGATTENPSFTVIAPLISRSRVFIFKNHTSENILTALKKGFELLNKNNEINIEEGSLELMSDLSNNDIRFALNSLEIAFNMSHNSKVITKKIVESALQKTLKYDKNGDEHYNIISAIHKSLRSSNPTAAVYWIMRMLDAGEDPLFIARRLIRFASEDIGNANTNALLLANTVYDTCHKIGMPECDTALVQLAEYLAKSPKNNRSYIASKMAREDIKQYGNLQVPIHLRNAPTKLMKQIGYGKGYEYDHDLPEKKSTQQCLPDEIKDKNYFE
ncbi:MAG: replication-associated recombination protein A [bacterium]